MAIVLRITVLYLLVLLSVPGWAQSGLTGGLSGTVTDPGGSVVPGAAVDVKNVETGLTRKTTTNQEGYWEVRFLPTGKYQAQIEAQGFQKLVQTDLNVEAAVLATLPSQLQIGSLAEAVTVVAEPPLVSSNTATTFRQIDTRELLQVPTATRSFTHLLSAEPGVSADLPPALVNGTGNISPSVNGFAPHRTASSSTASMLPTFPATKAHSPTTSRRPRRHSRK